jgi:hypothetical protein
VRGSDGVEHLLRHDEISGTWKRIPVRRRQVDP